MRISVIGCGYLGAVHAASMAKLGHDVVAVDVDPAKIERLAAGEAPFFEPGLPEILAEALASGRIRFTTDMAEVAGATVHFLAVGTPQGPTGAADLTYVDAAVASLTPYLSAGEYVVGKSTVPVGTAARLAAEVEQAVPGATLVWNPEFLREGFAVQDTISPDRLVYGVPAGAAGERATAVLDEVYATALAEGTPRLVVDLPTAELVKVSANAFLATKISFINAMAEIAEVVGADVTALADAIGHDARIGRKFLNAGLGSAAAASRRTSARSRRAPTSSASPSRSRSSRTSTRSTSAAANTSSRWRRSCSAGTSRASASPCSDSRSSPTPTTSATPRRSTSRVGCTGSARRSPPTTRRPSSRRDGSTRSSTTSRRPPMPCAGPNSCSCSRSGTSSASSTRRPWQRSSRCPSWSMDATASTVMPGPPPVSRTVAWGAEPPRPGKDT